MARSGPVLFLAGAAAAAVAAFAVIRHRAGSMGREVPGGILIANPAAYDALTHRLLLGSLFRPIAADIAAQVPAGSRVLEVGCGPGHLAIRLAGTHELDVTGVDLDPAMIERARGNALRETTAGREPTFSVADAASLPFSDASFDVVVSTLSLHHWADPKAGLAEISRVLRPGGRALIWEFRSVLIPFHPFHGHRTDPLEHVRNSPLRLVSATPWRWPWRLSFLQRIELAHP